MTSFTGLDQQLPGVGARLDQVLRTIEPVFVEAGNHLTASVEQLGGLTHGFGAMAARLEADDTKAALAALRSISGGIGQFDAAAHDSERRLEAVHARAAGLGPRIARLRKTIGEVRVLAVNAKVEAAHVTARDMDFSVFTREIGRLVSLADAALGRLSDELSSLLATVTEAREDLAAFAREHRRSLADVGARLSRGLAAMAERSRQSAQSIRSLAETSERMAGAVAHTVQGLQVGDMTRQRGEHVVEALQTLCELMATADISSEHRNVLIASVCHLQAAQAGSAADDLAREVAGIDANLVSLVEDVTALPSRCSSAYAASGDESASFLAEQSRQLQEAHALLTAYADAQAKVDQVVAEISRAVAGMVRHIDAIHSIEADMRVMGLNATFKCARLGGQGRALSVIAQELRLYSNRTAEDGSAIMAELGELMEVSGHMGASEAGNQSAQRMEAEMAGAVQTLDAVGGDLTAAMASLAHGCRRTAQSLTHARSLLDGHPEFVAALREAAAKLGAVNEGKAPPADALLGIREEVLEALRSRYTMSAERKIHGLLGEPDAGDDPSSMAGVDDLLF